MEVQQACIGVIVHELNKHSKVGEKVGVYSILCPDSLRWKCLLRHLITSATQSSTNHICNSIVHKINTTLRNDEFVKGSRRDGKPKYVISEANLGSTLLVERIQHYQSIHAGFPLTLKYSAHFKNVFLRGKGTFTACHMQLLMLALPFALRDHLGPEIALLGKEPGKLGTACLVDPSTDMLQALNRFLDWFVMARQIMVPVADVPELQRRALTMKEELQRVFP